MTDPASRASLPQLALAALLAAAPAPAPAQPAPPEVAPGAADQATVVTGYGEINLNRPSSARDSQIDLRRFVLGVHHRFGERTKFVSEVEIEHAVSSRDDRGEVEIEQAYVEHQFGPTWTGRAGLVLMPLGLLNESHEPTAYYGVERNFVETAIIPTTWREGALEVVASFENGLTLQAGVSTSFDVNNWDASSSDGRESPLGAIHQELQLARAHDVAGFAALNWRGIPGLQLGGAAFAAGVSQGQPGTPRATVVLWDVHGRWTPWRLDLSALYSRGTISNTAALNAPLVGNPTLIPEAFFGWYLQAACRAWSDGELVLSPFLRYERFNTGSSYRDLGPGLTPAALDTEGVLTAGANLVLTPGVVFKADVQRFRTGTGRNRVDLGVGWSF
jgi:hypothetical protein